ncbi:MAG: alpha/beta fold hydrolase [Acidobacteriia bacterium]|nr:alpha/beta fold hydrolase [Terriglobia bacterium]
MLGARLLFLAFVISTALRPAAAAQGSLPLGAPRPIAAGDSLWTEELTWMEVRDAIKAGKTTVLVATGGVEQNGPYVAGGKHNYVLQTVLPYIARAIENTLIAPIVKFVPEGAIEPSPTGHMLYPGTISVEDATFEALLTDICRSYKAHGFRDIVLLGDSGGNQAGMEKVANALNSKWAGTATRVHYLAEYYSEDPWSYEFLKSRGIVQIDKTPAPGEKPDRPAHTRNGIHDDIYYEAQIAVHDPKLIRADERLKAGLFSLHGVNMAPIAKTIELGRELAEYRAGITANAFQRSLSRLRVGAQAHVSFPAQDGGLVFADVYGKGERGVVLAHGGRFNKESWSKQARVLADAGFRVLAIDFRGYGESRGPGQSDIYNAPLRLDVLAAVRYLRKTGAKTVSLVGGSMGGDAAAGAMIEAQPGEIDRLVLLAALTDAPPEKLNGRKLFIIARDDADGTGPRLPRLRAYYEKTPEPKEMIILDGSAHAQFLFQTDQADRVMREILRFLTAP